MSRTRKGASRWTNLRNAGVIREFTKVFKNEHEADSIDYLTEEDLIAVDGKVVERNSAVVTHRRGFMGMAPTGKRVSWSETRIA